MPDAPTTPAASRRALLAGACGLGVVAAAGACATYGGSGADKASASNAPAAAGSAVAGSTGGPGGAGGTALAKVADIPVGGGKIFTDQKVVVTQPQQGTIKAFSTTCTHAGCAVDEVSGGTINCPCHGSKYRIADGAVAAGPAPKPLPAVAVTVNGDTISLA
jgi:Rieske Fe-S protein